MMLYDIVGLIPRNEEMAMNQYAFGIRLFPEWRGLVAKYDCDQDKVDYWCRKTMGPEILKSCGFSYGDIRIRWGEWGPENISVPGNACGLDLWDDACSPAGGKELLSHNVDTMHQAYCLLCVFTWFASAMITEHECRAHDERIPDGEIPGP